MPDLVYGAPGSYKPRQRKVYEATIDLKREWRHARFFWEEFRKTLLHRIFPDIEDYLSSNVNGFAMDNADIIINEIVRELSHPGHGKYYKVGPRRKQYKSFQRRSGKFAEFFAKRGKHRASAPGEPPAVWTSSYRDSWDFKAARSGSSVDVYFGSPLYSTFGRRLEWGGESRRGSARIYIQPRPHLRPAVRRALGIIEQRIARLGFYGAHN
jgi:hypothetical protein